MRFTSIIPAIALTSALVFGGAAYAQAEVAPLTINGLTVTDVDLPLVQEYCDQLAEGMKADTPTGESPDAVNNNSDETNNDDMTNESDDSEPTIDLGKITIEGCMEAGLTAAQ